MLCNYDGISSTTRILVMLKSKGGTNQIFQNPDSKSRPVFQTRLPWTSFPWAVSGSLGSVHEGGVGTKMSCADDTKWAESFEGATILRAFCHFFWKYKEDGMEFLVVSFFFQLCFLGGQKLQEEVPAFDRESIRREIVPMFQRCYWLHFPEKR